MASIVTYRCVKQNHIGTNQAPPEGAEFEFTCQACDAKIKLNLHTRDSVTADHTILNIKLVGKAD